MRKLNELTEEERKRIINGDGYLHIEDVCPKCNSRSLSFDTEASGIYCVKPSCGFEQYYTLYTEPRSTKERYLSLRRVRVSPEEAAKILDTVIELSETSLTDVAKVAKERYLSDDDKAVACLNIERVIAKLHVLMNHIDGGWWTRGM